MPDFLYLAHASTLDFVNTEVILKGVRTDLLQSFSDLTRWLQDAGMVPGVDLRRLSRAWAGSPDAEAALRASRALRGVLRAAVERIVATKRLPANLAGTLSKQLQRPLLSVNVLRSQGRIKTTPRWRLERPRDLIAILAHAAANFFATAEYSAVRKCDGPSCILFFYDASRNRKRRWCSMARCGNRVKVSAFRRRLRKKL